jgi:signal transduction histidine kinase
MYSPESDDTNLTGKLIRLINNISVQFLDIKEEQEVYQILADAIKKILPKSYFFITKLQPDDMNFRIVEHFGFEKVGSVMKTIVGKDPLSLDYPFKDLTDDQLCGFETRKIFHFKGGVYDIANGALNKTVCKTLEKLLGVKEVYAMSFCVHKKYFGGITFFNTASSIKSGILNNEAGMAIEIIANQASTVIQKFRDEAELKKNEEKLKDQTKQLIELNQTKDKFFTIIAHDLKSPLHSILGFLEFLSKDYDTYSDEEHINFIKMLSDSTKNVFELLENLLDWSAIQQGHIEMKKETFNLHELVDEGIKPYLINATLKEICIRNNIEANILMRADRNSIKTVIRNLFINSVKYTKKDGCVEFIATKNNNHIEFKVTDTGLGMSHETINKLFRIEESSSMPGTDNEMGTGLGLILCKELIHKNKGKIWVESELGKGTVFKIVIPA